MKLNLIVVTIVCVTSLSFQCRKDKPDVQNELPPVTQSGQNIFACHINGDSWISDKGLSNMGGAISSDSFDVVGTRQYSDGHLEKLLIRLYGSYNPSITTYSLNNTTTSYAIYNRTSAKSCFSISGGYGDVIVRKVTGGTVTITKRDTINRIISGTFSFYVPTDFCDTLKVTDGRFDIKY